jgi:transposase
MARRAYRRFSKEFKLEAIRLAEESGKPKAQIARELGIRVNQIGKWRKQLEEQPAGASSGKGCPAERADELKRLRRELADAREENEILKKAAAYFARNQR